jgi:hypothetical protein
MCPTSLFAAPELATNFRITGGGCSTGDAGWPAATTGWSESLNVLPCTLVAEKASFVASKSSPNASGVGDVLISWWTQVQGIDGDGESIFLAEGAFSLQNVPNDQEERSLTFLWVQPTPAYDGLSQVTLSYAGDWIQGSLDGIAFGGAITPALDNNNPGQIHFNLKQTMGCSDCGPTRSKNENLTIHYQILSPEFCSSEDRTYTPIIDTTNLRGFLSKMICTAVVPSDAQNNDGISFDTRGVSIYPRLQLLEQQLANGGARPTIARVAGIRLNQAWTWLNAQFGPTLRQDAATLSGIGAYLTSTADPNSSISLLLRAHANYDDQQQRNQAIQNLLGSMQSRLANTPLPESVTTYFDLINETLGEPALISLEQIDTAALGVLILGTDILDDGNLRGLEADAYAAHAHP